MTIQNFNFYNPTRILFGKGQIKNIGQHIPEDAKVLITYGGGSVKKYGTFDKVVAALGTRQWDEFGGIEPNPHYETLIKAVDKIKEEGFNFILAVGGGSVIDGTKFISAAATFEGDPINIFGGGIGKADPVTSAMPFGAILTLPATSSEMNSGGVVTFVEKEAKLGFGTPYTFPQFSVLDPELTYSLPQRQLANGISDTFIHILENYLTRPENALLQDGWSETALRSLIAIAPKLQEDNHDYDIRSNFMWICTNGLNGFMSQGVPGDWATHKLGHEITAFNGTDHAKTLVPVMLATMIVRKDEKLDKIIQYGRNVWNLDGDDATIYQGAIDKTRQFFQSIHMPVTLDDIDVTADDIDYLVNQLEKHTFTHIGENKAQTLQVSRKIYQTALSNSAS